jgi:putative heme transporter
MTYDVRANTDTGAIEGISAVDGEEMVSAPSLPSRRSAVIRSALILLFLLVVFGVILPQYVDYTAVWEALVALTPPQILLMTVIGAICWFVAGQLFTVLIPGVSPLRGNAAYLISAGIGSSIPFGPWNLGVIWVVFRGWGVPFQAATSGVALYGIINTLGRFALPLIAIVVVLVGGGAGSYSDAALILSIISIAIFFVSVGVMLVVVNSQQAADWLGTVLGRIVAWILARLGRSEHPDVLGSIHRFQRDLGEVVHRRGLAGLLLSLASQGPWIVAFIVALRLTGVPNDVLTPGDIVAVYALVGLITIIPIAPGGAGLPEILYIAGMSAIAGEQWESQITAGVFLFRLYAWFLPIPLAWILLKIVRRGQPMLPTGQELRAIAGSAT